MPNNCCSCQNQDLDLKAVANGPEAKSKAIRIGLEATIQRIDLTCGDLVSDIRLKNLCTLLQLSQFDQLKRCYDELHAVWHRVFRFPCVQIFEQTNGVDIYCMTNQSPIFIACVPVTFAHFFSPNPKRSTALYQSWLLLVNQIFGFTSFVSTRAELAGVYELYDAPVVNWMHWLSCDVIFYCLRKKQHCIGAARKRRLYVGLCASAVNLVVLPGSRLALTTTACYAY